MKRGPTAVKAERSNYRFIRERQEVYKELEANCQQELWHYQAEVYCETSGVHEVSKLCPLTAISVH